MVRSLNRMRGPCAKRRVVCTIHDGTFSATGENDCANPQATCPRLPGEGYEKCKTVCQQDGHAEMMALAAAKHMDLKGKFSWARITGHHWICNACGEAMRDAGVNVVQLDLA
jgi:deoxycytidylate deaminase